MNVFSNLTSPESLYIFLWLLGAFIIGLIVGWFTWGTAKRKLEAELADLNAKHLVLNGDYDNLKLELSGVKATYSELKADYDWKAQRLHDIETEKGDLHTKIYGLKDKLKLEGNAKVALQNQIDGLNASYNGAKSESEALELKVKGLEAELQAAAQSHTELTTQLEELKVAYGSHSDISTTIESDLETANETIAALNARIQGLESDVTEYKDMVVNLQDLDNSDKTTNTKIAVLEGKVLGLKEQLADCQAGKIAVEEEVITSKDVNNASEDLTLESAKLAIAAALAGNIGTASADDKDDLTQISGIGEFIQGKLNGLGIYKFGQIANFDDDMIANITHAIEFFPGRIERDEWVPQAKELSGGSAVLSSILEDLDEDEDEVIEVEGAPAVDKIDVATAREIVISRISSMELSSNADEKDDLKVISGVGPFIEEKLNALGIFTYEQISLFDSELEDRVTDAIEFFPGRIKRDEWVKQAKDLLKQKKSDVASSSLQALIGGKISVAAAEDKDDLKVISGVGPFIEEKLNSLGIYTYKQVSEFDEEIIDLVTDAIMFFPGRIVRDGWVEQAAEMHAKK
ncbi:MAG: hypothetical protein HC803_03490 [Saprospiraceae bacterium]|nr:hypothetical protein [Saprospiraceae bacterium]